jgi:hypothetical protein
MFELEILPATVMIVKLYIIYRLELIIHSRLVNIYFAVSAIIFTISYAGI